MSRSHGLSKTGAYQAWYQMLQRCYNKNRVSYKNYGGRGIWVCYRWKKSFMRFYEDMGNRPEGMSLDRIDNDASYRLSNCKWSTRKEQVQNTRRSVLITYQDRTVCLGIWAETAGIAYHTFYMRIFRHKWTVEKALSTPVQKRKSHSSTP